MNRLKLSTPWWPWRSSLYRTTPINRVLETIFMLTKSLRLECCELTSRDDIVQGIWCNTPLEKVSAEFGMLLICGSFVQMMRNRDGRDRSAEWWPLGIGRIRTLRELLKFLLDFSFPWSQELPSWFLCSFYPARIRRRVVCLWGFHLLLSSAFCISKASNYKTMAASAAYAAVLTVFVSNGSKQ